MEKHTSASISSMAAHIMDGGPYSPEDVKTLAASCLAQAPEHDHVQGLPVAGYKPTQSAEAIAAVNVFKELEERTLRHIENLQDANTRDDPFVDPRLLAVGRTQLQGAFMFLARAIFQPGRVSLPEDGADDHLVERMGSV